MSRLKLIELGRDSLNRKISVNEFVSNIVIARRESYEAKKQIKIYIIVQESYLLLPIVLILNQTEKVMNLMRLD